AAGLERGRRIALTGWNRRKQRERVERRRLVVIRVRARKLAHPIRVRAIARGFCTVAEEPFDGVEISLLAIGWRLRLTVRARRRQPPERRAGLVHVLVVPERLVVAHRLAPVRQGESGVEALRLPERGDRIVVLEAVKQQHAADERRLGRSGA